MAMPDIIFNDLLSAIYLTAGDYDRNLMGGLLTKKELLEQVFGIDLYHYQQTELEHRILAAYEHYAELQLISNAEATDYCRIWMISKLKLKKCITRRILQT